MTSSLRSPRFYHVLAALNFPFLILLFFPLTLAAQRLPQVALPQHYSLQLTPNLATATFTGDEAIDLILSQPVEAITLNAIEIKFDQVTAEAAGKTLPAEVSLDPAKQQATFHFAERLPAGPVTLRVKYSGILNSELRGFYLSKTARRKYAVTQFEPTDARRAFPSFDEPAFKASFDVSLTVSKDDTAISNTNIVSDTPGPGAGQHTLRFARTPKMSTYLVAFLVGDFKCLSGESDGGPIRVCAIPEEVNDGAFALSAAEFFLHYYDAYFGIKYPMPKLDLIALPDFEAGAMENFGAITFRETALLLDPKAASVGAQKLVAVDVAHEMAHQWFGDMVTMNWWDNIWLNEGFATWMENKPVAAWKPEWHIPEDVAIDLNDTLDLDARTVTRTIRATANTPGEINEMFDGITYGKAGAVLLMVENYLGEETFRRGVHAYLEAHMYANATAEDFWNAQTEVSRKPVDKIMEGLVTQPGEPLLTFGRAHDGKADVTQRRFFLNPAVESEAQPPWTLPVCLKSGNGPNCQILSEQTQALEAPPAPVFFGNAGGKGYYRSQYDARDYQQLMSQAETALDPAERIVLLGSQWALTRAEKGTVADFMSLAGAVKDDRSAGVIETVTSALGTIDQRVVSTPQEHQLLAAWVRKTFAAPFEQLGPSSAADTPNEKELRAVLFFLLGSIGDDPAVLAHARQLADQYLAKTDSVDPTLATAALRIAAQNGDQTFFDHVQRVSETTNNPQLHSQTLYTLARFRDPAMVERALQYAVSGKVRNQDSARLIAFELSDRSTQDQAWKFIQQNWAKVEAQTTVTSGGDLVASAGGFCSTDRGSQIASFFAQHKVPAAETALVQAQESIRGCVELRAAQGPSLNRWLWTNGN